MDLFICDFNTYPKSSYGIGVGEIPLMIIMRPLKPGVKISRVNL